MAALIMSVRRGPWDNVVSGHPKSGASTITMQVARNFFLSSEKTLTRQIQRSLAGVQDRTQPQQGSDSELYFNPDLSGPARLWFCAAGQAYYGRPLKELSIAQMAMLAGLPKAPSSYNLRSAWIAPVCASCMCCVVCAS